MTLDFEALKADVARQRAKYPEEVAQLEKERWIRVMCDFSADGVWNQDGLATSPEVLPISIELMVRIHTWQAVYETLDPMDGPVDPNDFVQFVHEGFLIAVEMKRQLPNWTIIYHDDGRAGELGGKSGMAYRNALDRYRLWFEYEITDAVIQSGQKPYTSLDELDTLVSGKAR